MLNPFTNVSNSRLSILPGAPTTDLPPIPKTPETPMNLLSTLLAHKLRYLPGERDMVILSHEVITSAAPSSPHSTTRQVHSSSLITYGNEHNSAMSLTVGLPLAFSTLRILDGEIRTRGVADP